MQGRKLFSLSLVLALVESISFPAHAELFKNLKLDGSLETRSFGIDNEVDRNGLKDDYRSETNVRMMFGATYDLLDDVHGKLLLDREPARFGSGSPSVEGVEGTLIFDNAYVKIDKVFGHIDLTLGKQFYGDPNDLNIYFGPNNDDVLSVASIDAFRVDADLMGLAKFQGIAGTAAEAGTAGAGANTDTTIVGGEVNTDKVIPMGSLAAYYYTGTAHTPHPPALGNNTLSVAGVRATGDIPMVGGLGYHGEFMQDFGRNNAIAGTPAHDGSAYFLGLHFGHEMSAMPIRAKLEYGRGSDDFLAIAPSARFGLIWGEHTSVAGAPSTLNRNGGSAASLSNIKVIDGGIGINPIAKLGLDFNAYRFLYDANIAGAGVSAGTEYDFIVSWKHSDNVSFEVNAATFQVGSALQNTPGSVTGTGAAPVSTNPITRLGADVKIKY